MSVDPHPRLRCRLQAYLFVSVWFLWTLPAFAGLYCESRASTEPGMGDMAVRSWVDGNKARIEIVESNSPLFGEGAYMITNDGGSTMFMINEQMKTISRVDLGSLMGGIGGILEMKFGEPEITLLEEKAGGEVAGYPTRYYRFRLEYDQGVSILGIERTERVREDQELWVSDAFDYPALESWLGKDGKVTSNDEFNRLIRAEMNKVEGLPLKTITVHRSGKSDRTVVIERMVTLLREEEVPEERFHLPQGYVEIPMTSGFGTLNGFAKGEGGQSMEELLSVIEEQRRAHQKKP